MSDPDYYTYKPHQNMKQIYWQYLYHPDNHQKQLTYLLSCTVSKLWLIIGQIFASDKGVPDLNALAGGDHLRISP